jgi:SAM-dependent methyltransferase
MSEPNLIKEDTLRFDVLIELSRKPELFEPGAFLFWDDPHISEQMLGAHLSPDTETASRKPEVIDRTVDWLVTYLDLSPGQSVLDLGCGPGLYASRLSRKGLDVTGIDYSRSSIDYAKAYAREHRLPVTYLYQDFLTIEYDARFDVVMQIYGELCTFSPAPRDRLFAKVHRALKPGGRFVFDVSTGKPRGSSDGSSKWYVGKKGFWKPGPHLVLEQGFDYAEHNVHVDQFIVIEADGSISLYRNWFVDYSLETITAALEKQGFRVKAAWSDLGGTAYDSDSEWIGIIATQE